MIHIAIATVFAATGFPLTNHFIRAIGIVGDQVITGYDTARQGALTAGHYGLEGRRSIGGGIHRPGPRTVARRVTRLDSVAVGRGAGKAAVREGGNVRAHSLAEFLAVTFNHERRFIVSVVGP